MATSPATGKPTVKDLHAYTGRLSGPQLFYQVPFVAGSNNTVPKNIPMDSPLAEFIIEWTGRIVVGVANYTSVSPESLLNLVPSIKIFGTHVTLGQQTLYQGSLATLFKMAKIWKTRGNSLYINGVRISDDQIGAGLTSAQFGNTGTFDIDMTVVLPFAPFGVSDSQALLYYLNENAWNTSLQVQYLFGDATSLGVPGGTTTVTFSAFGAGGGSPVMNLLLNYGYLGPMASKIGQAVVVRNVIPINSVLQSVAGALIRIQQLQNQKTTGVIAKTGTSQAGTGGPYATLSDTILEGTVIRKNNALVRNLFKNSVTKDDYGQRMQTVQPTGYLGILFDDGDPCANAWAALRADLWGNAAQLDIASNVPGGAGTNQGEIIQEYIIGDPVVAL